MDLQILVTRYNMRDYNGILNLENLQAFPNDSISNINFMIISY